ncbi:MAG: DinB family protein [Anaerolineae bacterium]|nr:DinB family protein [Anaerolineae bacterium]MDQ7037566.1 DinB family protein [Anaerolineae bacterium]
MMANSKRADGYIHLLGVNGHVIQRQLDGLSHDDTLLQPDMRGNCANWILGHINVSRSSLMERLGLEPVWGETAAAIYAHDTPPITDATCPHFPLEQLMADFTAAGEQIIARLETISDEELDADISETNILAGSVSFTIWHEAYHVGQFEYLRQLTGVDDKVI